MFNADTHTNTLTRAHKRVRPSHLPTAGSPRPRTHAHTHTTMAMLPARPGGCRAAAIDTHGPGPAVTVPAGTTGQRAAGKSESWACQ